jgi:hypothetical protein
MKSYKHDIEQIHYMTQDLSKVEAWHFLRLFWTILSLERSELSLKECFSAACAFNQFEKQIVLRVLRLHFLENHGMYSLPYASRLLQRKQIHVVLPEQSVHG